MRNCLTANGKLCLLEICVLLVAANVRANTYYFSAALGDDSRSTAQAQNAATPWKTIDKLNAFFSQLNAGDAILFHSSEVFYGSIVVSKSGSSGAPIAFGSYGAGSKPIITGFTVPASWTNKGANIWETTLPVAVPRVNSVLFNGSLTAAGRYPNADAANKGYLNIQSAQGSTSITMANNSGGNNWTGGEVVIRKARWVIDRNPITSQQGVTINYTSQSGYGASAGYGYFIQNHPNTLDQEGEWYYQNSGSKFGIYSSTGSPSNGSVGISTIAQLVNLSYQSNIQFTNLRFTGANDNAFFLDHSSDITIQNCEMLYGYNGMTAWSTNNLSVTNCNIQNSGNNACRMEGCNNVVLKSNAIKATGVFAGMGDGDSGSYEGLLLSGSNQTIEGNTIDSTGYIAITFRGSNVVVKNNVVNVFSFVKDDGSGIYTWNNVSNPPTYTGEVIANNIVLSGVGAGEGTPDPSKRYANGIYMDDNAGGVEISGNTVASCSNYGFYIHNAHDLSILNNTVYNNTVQLEMTHDDIAPFPIRNITMTGNKFLAKLASQSVAEFKTNADDINSYGTFDNNYYSRPFLNDLQIGVLTKPNGTYQWNPYNLEGWKAAYGKDLNSKTSPITYQQFKVNSLTSSNLYANAGFLTSLLNTWVESNSNNAILSLVNGILDGNALQVAFNNTSGNSNAIIFMNTGSVQANHQYILKFSLKGTVANKMMSVYLRQSSGSYGDIVDRQYFSTTTDRTEMQFLFTPSMSVTPHLGITVPDAAQKVYIDNVQLIEANATVANPDDSLKFVYNTLPTSTNTTLDGSYIDVAETSYTPGISLSPYTSAVLLKKSSAQSGDDGSVVCSATGSILSERWIGISGNDVSNIPLQTAPANSSQLTLFEIPTDAADNYGTRIRGYICPPQTGNYTFWIAGDDATELWLSSDSTAGSKTKIAYNLSWTNSREWGKFATQKSVSIYLIAGHKYYIEALHKEGNGGDNLAVAWQLPSGSFEGPIAGTRLSPYVITSNTLTSQTISFPAIGDKTFGDAPFTLSATASSGLPVSYTVVSGPATLVGNLLTITSTGVIMIQASQSGNGTYATATSVTQSFTANSPVQCTATGTILREQWNNISGNSLSSIPWQATPASTSNLTSFESPSNIADNYGARIRGYICPPQSGNYTFWIAADDVAELWLSTDDNNANRTLIASVPAWTNSREWNKYASQKSASIYLLAGHKYYVEALHKEGNGGDNLAVAWQLPSGTVEAPISGSRLSAATGITAPTTTCSNTGSIVREQWNNIGGNNINSIPLQTTANSTSTLTSFEAPLNITDNYGARIRGYICVPTTGNYTFWIAADDQAQLWLSTTDNESNKALIASVPYWTGSREWGKYPSQKSVSIYLMAGQRYYIEALHKEGNGGDNLAVAWQLPDNTTEAPIPGSRLMPFAAGNTKTVSSELQALSTLLITGDTSEENKNKPALNVYPNPISSAATIEVNLKEVKSATLQLVNEQGRIVKSFAVGMNNKTDYKFTLYRDGLPGGLYIIRLITSSGVLSKKIIVAKVS